VALIGDRRDEERRRRRRRMKRGEAAILWQPAQENTVISPKTNPLWSLSNNKVSSCH
jgi:hypothetical protein